MFTDFNIENFIKYSIICAAVQVALVIGLIISGSITALELVLTVYYPSIMLVSYAGGFRGESTMMLPVLAGGLLGIGFYAMIIGVVITRLKRNLGRD